jgi:D-3-phosphoglycerate dehydrogenase / 2-oxoglutarate reductase
VLEVEYQGQIAGYDTRILTLSLLKGYFGRVSEEPVSFVNAPQLAAESGIQIRETATTTAHHYVNLITVRSGDHALAGTLVGLQGDPRIVMVDDHTVDVPPSAHMLVVRNDDRPGMIGAVGTLLGDADINIAGIHVGQSAAGLGALMVLATASPVPVEVVRRLESTEGIVSVHAVDLV